MQKQSEIIILVDLENMSGWLFPSSPRR